MDKILMIEDDQSIANLMRDYLEVSNFFVELCSDGREGVKKAKQEDYDLILLDVMLPHMNGFDVLKIIRETSDVPVLLVSAKKEEIDKIKGLGLGADDYITKPFSPSELVARVKAHIAKYRRISFRYEKDFTSIVIGAIEIQKDARRVLVKGKEVLLAQKEFELLWYLMQNPNRLFGREELFERIWGLDSLGDSATVTVHIARIREKIEEDPSQPQYIETVWGGGYRFKSTL